jgi:hypothetical protein
MPVQTEVVGIKALARDLLEAANDQSGKLLPYLQQAAMTAMEPIAQALRGKLPRGPTGRLIGSVRVRRTRTGATVAEGDNSQVVYAPQVDFGGYPGNRPYFPNGRYLFPTVQGMSLQAQRIYEDAIQKGLDGFPWTNVTTDPEAVHD